ncbi:uncharacterized protein DUF1080 [Neolewinella xylanilytica]|uniref:Uncharacterized protein DUF1080 n=1 Tax=Neolewinella xylanilytica TaxID=1514080 RepID=A0A2S6I208_9BACT|nr:DUF1080 domain-containing protein [Neolewinella xylanilytica]PPK85204.1 uncharacterized protein DUF1080 [Neolewinella xylanilytica]
MSIHRYALLPYLVLSCTALSAQGEPLLFDATFSGWRILVADRGEVDVDEQEYFVWEDSLLHVYPTATAGSRQPFAALTTDSSYSAYRLHLEYKWGEKRFAPRDASVRDAGVLFHVYETDVFWPSGLECQIQEGDTRDAWLIGARATSPIHGDARNFSPSGQPEVRTGERYTKFARSFSWEQEGWNSIDLEVSGDSASFYVNGHLVNALSQALRPGTGSDWAPLTEGFISLQAEGAELYYRNVRISLLE